MAQNQQLDSLHFDSLDFPYNTEQNPLTEKPRIATGSNTYATWGGSIAKRPGTIGLTGSGLSKRMDRMWLYQTIEASPKIYILGSAYNSSTTYWEMYYLRLDDTVPAWTIFTNLRDVNNSTAPHECVIARGFAYIKGLPLSSSSEKLGSIRMNGTGGTVTFDYWGILGPINNRGMYGTATSLVSPITSTDTTAYTYTSLSASPYSGETAYGMMVDQESIAVTNDVAEGTYRKLTISRTTLPEAFWGWKPAPHAAGTPCYRIMAMGADIAQDAFYSRKYSFSWKTRTGQVSNRLPMLSVPLINGDVPSETGAYGGGTFTFDFRIQTAADSPQDATYVPSYVVHRTTDGGGTFFALEEATNTGAVPQTYRDDSFVAGTKFGTLPDSLLGAGELAPSTTSNSPPPTCNAPLITGTDTPVQYSPIAYYASRIWFAINEVLYFSAQEELTMGVPEESFPSGLKGNFFRYSHPIKNVVATTDGLYVLTTNSIHQITGTNRESFNSRPVLDSIGVPTSQPRAACRLGDAIAFLADDERVLLLQNGEQSITQARDNVISLSDPIGSAIGTKIAAGCDIDFDYYKHGSYEWLIVSCHKGSDTTSSAQYICDLKRSRESNWKDIFWYTPWTIKSTACISGRIKETETRHRLIWFVWNGTTGSLVYLDDSGSTFTDAAPVLGDAASNYAYSWGTNLFTHPPGNHINALRKSTYNPVFHEIRYDRKTFSSDTDPTVTYYLDDNYETAGTAVSSTEPTRRTQSSGYKSLICPIRKQCQRIAAKFNATTDKGAEFHNLSLSWESEGGS